MTLVYRGQIQDWSQVAESSLFCALARSEESSFLENHASFKCLSFGWGLFVAQLSEFLIILVSLGIARGAIRADVDVRE